MNPAALQLTVIATDVGMLGVMVGLLLQLHGQRGRLRQIVRKEIEAEMARCGARLLEALPERSIEYVTLREYLASGPDHVPRSSAEARA